jgi:chemotaxis response regulator CheB
MPREAVAIGAVDHVIPLHDIANATLSICCGQRITLSI